MPTGSSVGRHDHVYHVHCTEWKTHACVRLCAWISTCHICADLINLGKSMHLQKLYHARFKGASGCLDLNIGRTNSCLSSGYRVNKSKMNQQLKLMACQCIVSAWAALVSTLLSGCSALKLVREHPPNCVYTYLSLKKSCIQLTELLKIIFWIKEKNDKHD